MHLSQSSRGSNLLLYEIQKHPSDFQIIYPTVCPVSLTLEFPLRPCSTKCVSVCGLRVQKLTETLKRKGNRRGGCLSAWHLEINGVILQEIFYGLGVFWQTFIQYTIQDSLTAFLLLPMFILIHGYDTVLLTMCLVFPHLEIHLSF